MNRREAIKVGGVVLAYGTHSALFGNERVELKTTPSELSSHMVWGGHKWQWNEDEEAWFSTTSNNIVVLQEACFALGYIWQINFQHKDSEHYLVGKGIEVYIYNMSHNDTNGPVDWAAWKNLQTISINDRHQVFQNLKEENIVRHYIFFDPHKDLWCYISGNENFRAILSEHRHNNVRIVKRFSGGWMPL